MMRTFLKTIGVLTSGSLLFFGGWKAAEFVYPHYQNTEPSKVSSAAPTSTAVATTRAAEPIASFCAASFTPKDAIEERYCTEPPKLTEPKGLQIDLTAQRAILFEDGKIVDVLPVAYQSPEGVWFQTPTGYFRVGFMHKEHRSSLFPVNMPYAIQITEDFFMHEIPFYDDGTKVTSKFSGGCLRFETEVAKRLFEFLKPGDQMVIYKTIDAVTPTERFRPPVAQGQYWVRQRFNSPLRSGWNHRGDLENLKYDYDEHTGVDFTPAKNATDTNAYAIADGTVAKVQQNDGADHGMGATVIIRHDIDGKTIYSLYAHLASIAPDATEGATIRQGAIVGTVGNTAYGCARFWRIGKDGCDSENPDDVHLHFEIKTMPILENPKGGTACKLRETGEPHACYGYTPDDPRDYGYLDPMKLLFDKTAATQ